MGPCNKVALSGQEITKGIILEEIASVIEGIEQGKVEEPGELLLSSPKIFVAAKGRSGYISRAFAQRLMHLGFQVYFIGETNTPALKEGDTLLICSGSGSAYFGKIPQGVKLLLITANKESDLAKKANWATVLLTPTKFTERADPLFSVQPMGSLFEQSLFLFLEAVVIYLMFRTEVSAQEMKKRHAKLE